MKHAVTALRIQLVDNGFAALLPWGILAITFVTNLLVFGLASGIPEDSRATGAIMSIYIVGLFANLSVWTQSFPFAIGLGLTRRAFFLGTLMLALAQSLVVGIGLSLLLAVENATGGCGLSLQFFGLDYLVAPNGFLQVVVYALPYLLVSTLGMVIGVVLKRWGRHGIYLLTTASVVVLCASAVLITWQGWWGGLWEALSGSDPMAVLAGYPAVVALALAGLAYLGVRRATP